MATSGQASMSVVARQGRLEVDDGEAPRGPSRSAKPPSCRDAAPRKVACPARQLWSAYGSMRSYRVAAHFRSPRFSAVWASPTIKNHQWKFRSPPVTSCGDQVGHHRLGLAAFADLARHPRHERRLAQRRPPRLAELEQRPEFLHPTLEPSPRQ